MISPKLNSLTSIQAPTPSLSVAKSVPISPSRALLHEGRRISSEEALHPDVGTRMDSRPMNNKIRLSKKPYLLKEAEQYYQIKFCERLPT